MSLRLRALVALSILPVALGAQAAPARPAIDPALFAGLVWRNVGPFRAGRISAVTGAVGQPGVFYVGTPGGGVWKTTSAGTTWFPVFDAVTSVSSVGAIEAAPSNASVIYVGTGDMTTGGAINEGDGVYKSTDAGRSWQHLGLEATKQIPSILVDPRDADVLLVAAQGDIHRRSDTRGVYRSADGGRTWSRTLFVDSTTGIQKLARAHDAPDVVFATTVRHFTPPGPPAPRPTGPDTGRTGTAVYRSADGGATWTEVTGGGLPRLTGRTSVAVAAHTNARRVFLVTNAGLWRSDDAGASWRQMDSTDHRVRNGQGGYNCGVYVDPQHPDVVYVINTSSYVSRDGGETFTGFKGAPGGDDPQQLWIDPTDGQRMLMGLDQGASVTLDGGATWSSWYNQSTEQVYHLSTDTSFPYWIYATQQDAGAVATRSRGNLGAIGPLDWKPVAGWEWGTIVADPLAPDTVYASGNGIVKITGASEQWISVSPAQDPTLKLRTGFSQPIVFAPWDGHELLAGFQSLMATTDGGAHWRALSPDLGVPRAPATTLAGRVPLDTAKPPAPAPAPPPTGAIESISPSTVAAGMIWVGTNNGLVHVTRDHGKTWSEVSIPNLPTPTRALVSSIDASHHDAAEAYVAIDLHTTGDYAPYLFRTRDYGKTWTKITAGLPDAAPAGAFARVVRADTKRAGLLFAGTESAMWVSFDDGDHWQPLQLGLPTTSYRDAQIRGNDLVVGTYGRGIFVLDDVSPLRELSAGVASEPAHLFAPGEAVRVRRNVNADTPFPPEIPHALNPPEGVLLYYWLAAPPQGAIALDVLDASGRVVRHLSSVAAPPPAEAARPPHPNFWVAPPFALPTAAGTNRVNWDLRSDAPAAFSHSFEINANPGLTPASPEGPLAPPGTYTVRLTVNGRAYTQPLVVRNDPRSAASAADLGAQTALLVKLRDAAQAAFDAHTTAAALRDAVKRGVGAGAPAELSAAAATLAARLDSVAGSSEGRGFRGRGAGAPPPDFVSLNAELVRQLEGQDYADMAPTPAMLAAWSSACHDLATADARLTTLATTELAALNAMLARNNAPAVAAPPTTRSRAPGC